jgi:hypothetical protein
MNVLPGFMLALLLVTSLAYADPPKPLCVNAELKEHIRELYSRALDDAFRARAVHMLEVWIADYSPSQSERTLSGVVKSVEAYQRAYGSLARWNPPDCKKE